MPPRRGNFERALGGLLAFDVFQVRHRRIDGVRGGLRPAHALQPLEVIDEHEQVDGARIAISPDAYAASAPQAAGQIKPLPSASAPIAAGRAPATVAIEPSSASSPSTQ